MLSPTHRRYAASALLAVFAAFWGESLALTSCPMHSGAHASAPASAMPGMAHAAHVPDNSGGTPEHGATHDCNCLGTCVGAGIAALPGAHAAVVFATTVRADVAPQRPQVEVAHTGQTRLPFAQGPPARSESALT